MKNTRTNYMKEEADRDYIKFLKRTQSRINNMEHTQEDKLFSKTEKDESRICKHGLDWQGCSGCLVGDTGNIASFPPLKRNSTPPEENPSSNYMQVGKTFECGHCHPEKYEKVENIAPDMKCDCTCHTPPEECQHGVVKKYCYNCKPQKFMGKIPVVVIDNHHYVRIKGLQDFIAQEIRKGQEEVLQKLSDKIKYKFNGFGGTLGFTKNELLDLLDLTNKEQNK